MTAPSSYKESITTWPDDKLTKELMFFNNMYIVLDNQSPNFVRYEVSVHNGAIYSNFTGRNYTFRTSAAQQVIIRTVYLP